MFVFVNSPIDGDSINGTETVVAKIERIFPEDGQIGVPMGKVLVVVDSPHFGMVPALVDRFSAFHETGEVVEDLRDYVL